MSDAIEHHVKIVMECALLIAIGSDRLTGKRSKNRFYARKGILLSRYYIVARRIILAREAIEHAEISDDLDGARQLFDPGAPWLHYAEDDGLLRNIPDQLTELFDARQAVITKDGMADLLASTANAIEDPFLQKLALNIGSQVLLDADAWDEDTEGTLDKLAGVWGLSDFDFANWFENIVHPIVTGAPVSENSLPVRDLERIADEMQKIVSDEDNELTDEERKEVEELIKMISGKS